MLCSNCENLLDLDVSLPLRNPEFPQGPQFPCNHSLESFYLTAGTGCDICSAICSALHNCLPDLQEELLNADFDGEILFNIFSNYLFVTLSITLNGTSKDHQFRFPLHTSIGIITAICRGCFLTLNRWPIEYAISLSPNQCHFKFWRMFRSGFDLA